MAVKTYTGSCHCGKVKFSAALDLSKGSGKCNCSICRKSRSWATSIKPDAFKLLAGQDELSDYQFNTNSMHHLFCKTCGVRSFGRGSLEVMGGEFYTVNLACLDDVTPEEIGELDVHYSDGLNNNWAEPPSYTKHL